MANMEMKNEQTIEDTAAGTAEAVATADTTGRAGATELAETVGKKQGGHFSKKRWGIIGAIAVIVIALLIGVGISYSPSGRLRKQLDLGQKYLEEMKYEEAVVAFNNAIEIDPMSVDAYLGLVEVYIRTGDFETALSYAQKGYDLTGDERLKEKIDMIESGNITASNGWIMKMSYYNSGKLMLYMTYTYDLQGRKKTAALYNGANRLVGKGDYEYDEQGREIVGWGWSQGGDDPLSAELEKFESKYDAEGSRHFTRCDMDGNLLEEAEYDAEGRLICEKQYDGSGNLECCFENEYNAEGREIGSKHYDGAGNLDYYYELEYDAEGRRICNKIYDGSGDSEGHVEWGYDTEGREIYEKKYDSAGNLEGYIETEYNSEGRETAHRYYDASGNLTSEQRFE